MLLEVVEEAAKHPSIDETWIEVLDAFWEHILASKDTLIKLPEILERLSKTLVSEKYLEKLRSMKKKTEAQFQEIIIFLDQSKKC